MKCNDCDKTATVHVTEIRDGRKTSRSYCVLHAPVEMRDKMPPVPEPFDIPPTPAPPEGAEAMEPAPLGESSDEDLMRRTQRGDKLAFPVLYERYSASVRSYLYRMLGDVEDVDSIGQEVFLRAFRFAATYQYPHEFSTWLFTIARNLAINWARRGPRV